MTKIRYTHYQLNRTKPRSVWNEPMCSPLLERDRTSSLVSTAT